jgi:rubredoxin
MMRRYKCKVCNYIYDPEAGEPRTKTSPGTAFEDIPESWRCPKCGVPKFKFIPI